MKEKFLVKKTSRGLLLGLIAGSLTIAACTKSNNDNNNTENPAAGIMAVNLAPDKDAITIGLSGSVLTSSPLAYTNFTGGYIGIYPGSRTVDAYEINSSSPIASTPFNFETDKYYTSFTIGAAGTYKNLVTYDPFDKLTVGNGEAYFRFINAIPDSIASAVTIRQGGIELINQNAGFGYISDFASGTAGTLDISVSNGSTINTSRSIDIEGKKAYTLLLIGKPGSTAGGADSIQIKYIENGTLTKDSSQAKVAFSVAKSAQVN